jgi:phosphoribosylanthranilate isomerase
MHIKICGITNAVDALQAVQAGATHLGMIFVEKSPRHVTPQDAEKITAAVAKRAVLVGVFQNHSPEAIAEIVVTTGLDAIQLHGDEDPAFCRSIALRLGKPVIKTIILGEGNAQSSKLQSDAQALLQKKIADYSCRQEQVAYLLFDRAKGQTNEQWLRSALAQISSLEKQNDFTLPPYFFAGGLTVENIGAAISTIKPFGFDVASGVEASVGKKDPALVKAFIAKATSQTAPKEELRSKI